MTRRKLLALAAGAVACCAAAVLTRAAASPVERGGPFARIFGPDSAAVSTTQETKPSPEYTVAILARDTQFIPNTVRARAGSRLLIQLRNEGHHRHDLVFRALPYRTATVQPGQTANLSMVTPPPGRYEFYCSVSNHAKRGMVGTLIVKP